MDSLGSGVFLPFSVVYFVRSTSLDLTTVGAGLSVAALAAMTVIPLFGPMIDRFGPGRSVALSSLLQAVGFCGYLGVGTAWQLIVCAVLVNAGQNLYWTASGPAVLAIAAPDDRDRWFSLVRALRNIGIGAGTLLFVVAEAAGGGSAGRLLVAANALSFAVAGVLAMSSLPTATAARTGPRDEGPRKRRHAEAWRGYLAVLRDAPFLTVVVANVFLALCTMVMPVILAVHLTDGLGLEGWFAGALFTANAVLIAGTQTVFSRMLERLRPLRVLQLSALLWALCFTGLWTASALAPVTAMIIVGAAILFFTAAEMAHAPVMSSVVGRLAPEALRGRYFAVYQLSWTVPTALAPTVFTWLFHLGTAWLWATLLITCLASAGLLMPRNGERGPGPVFPAQEKDRTADTGSAVE